MTQIIGRKCGVIIQCREKSARLPDKWNLDLDGRNITTHVVDRCKFVINNCKTFFKNSNISFILIAAIPTGDNKLKESLEKHDCKVFEGDPDDVLNRFYQCTLKNNLYWAVRITGDCPMLDVSLSSSIINTAIMSNIDYVSNTVIRTYPDGFDTEVITFRSLEWLHENVKGKDREHVTSYLLNKDNQKEFMKRYSMAQFQGNIDLSNIKISLDTEEDYKRIKKEYDNIHAKKTMARHLGEKRN